MTLIGTIRTGTLAGECVYKPVRGERPLWDFPDGTLAGREIGAYLVSEATGWRVVPPTVLREGPFGTGHGAAVAATATRRSTWPPSCAATSPSCAGWRCSTRW